MEQMRVLGADACLRADGARPSRSRRPRNDLEGRSFYLRRRDAIPRHQHSGPCAPAGAVPEAGARPIGVPPQPWARPRIRTYLPRCIYCCINTLPSYICMPVNPLLHRFMPSSHMADSGPRCAQTFRLARRRTLARDGRSPRPIPL